MRTSFVDPINPSTPSTMSSWRDVSSLETGRLARRVDRVLNAWAADVPTATPRENNSSDLGREEKDMDIPEGGQARGSSQIEVRS